MENKYKISEILVDLMSYLIPIGIFLILSLYFLFMKGYYNSFLLLNSHYSPFFDQTMLILTFCSEPLFLIPVSLFLLTKRRFSGLCLIIVSVVISGLITQFLKHYVFDGWNRPPLIFGVNSIHTVSGYILNYNSLPSGHSTTIASVFAVLAYEFRGKKIYLVIASLLTIILSYTRIYLGVHFLGDIIFGNIIGLSCSISIILLYKNKIEIYLEKSPNRSSIFYNIFLTLSITSLVYSIIMIIIKVN